MIAEPLECYAPGCVIKHPVSHNGGGRSSHRKDMVKVVRDREALTAEDEESVIVGPPPVDGRSVFGVLPLIGRVDPSLPSRLDCDGIRARQPGPFEFLGNELTEVVVAVSPGPRPPSAGTSTDSAPYRKV